MTSPIMWIAETAPNYVCLHNNHSLTFFSVYFATFSRTNTHTQHVMINRLWHACCFSTLTEPARGTNDYCPRKNGIFSHPDETNCHTFYVCQDGEYIENKCTAGLHFDENSGTCVWEEKAARGPNCVAEKVALKDGFVCPEHKTNDRTGQIIAHPHYAHETDCQKFYVCLNGNEPRMYGCDEGEVYNDETKRCDQPKNVPGCEDWFDQPARK